MKYENSIPKFKSQFKKELHDFIIFKRSNGYKYGDTICYRLLELDTFFSSLNINDLIINQDIVDKWLSKCNSKNKETTKGKYFNIISTFCDYLRINSYDNIIQPSSNNLKFKSEFIPYIFTDEEIKRIFNIINKNEKEQNDLDNKCFKILITLYYCCGLRKNEALNLNVENYNHIEKTITIIEGKNNVSRIIPLNDELDKSINEYLKFRNSNNESLFITNKDVRYYKQKLYQLFHNVLLEANIPVRYDGKRQRLHDLRHTFAVNSLKQMQRKGFDLYTSLPVLSVYLGHKSIVETEYYLRMIQKDAENITENSVKYLQNLYNQKDEFYHE